MAGDYEKAISIKNAIEAINSRNFLLPAIQRKFVWNSQQICALFDSIMRAYPINTFMMWEINSDHIKNSYKFYEFLKSYCQRFEEENPHISTNATFPNFKAVIDGQQRLTSLYIGLCGTYAYKQPRIWWPSTKDDSALPPRKLYLDLKAPLKSEEEDTRMKFNFRFLTNAQYLDSKNNSEGIYHWYCLNEIMKLPNVEGASNIWSEIVMPYLAEHNLETNKYAQTTLCRLYEVIRIDKVIHYFNETSQEIDHVLDVFIRTNSGGTKLDFSDLLLSIAVANWDGDFRKELDDLVSQIHMSKEMGFFLGRDWILKTCLTLIDTDVRFKIENFKYEQVKNIQDQWDKIKDCIKQTFILIKRFGINPQSLLSKNAVIPICYYLFKKTYENEQLYKSINNLAKHHDQRAAISQWFYMALLKGVFGGQADTLLTSIREVLKINLNDPVFPTEKIVAKYIGSNKDLRFDTEYIEKLLDTQYGEGRCRALLHLLFPEMNATEIFHIDHLHPKIAFEKNSLKKISFFKDNVELFNFYNDERHWNSLANLHLLNNSQNLSKNDKPLKDWLNDPNVHLSPSSLLIEGGSLEFEDFKEFYNLRRSALRNRLINRVYMAASLSQNIKMDEADEEITEEDLLLEFD